MISAYDRKLRVIAWNKLCEKKFSITARDALGKNLLEIFPDVDNDYRVKCLKECALEGKDFYFAGLPYLYTKGFYSQLIIKISEGVIMIACDHKENEKISRNQLLAAIV